MFSANQKPFVICIRVTEELHSFLSQSELSNFFVYIIRVLYQLLFKLTCSKYFITLVLNSASFSNLMLLCCLFLFQVLVAIFPGEYGQSQRWRRNEGFVPTQMKYFETGIKSWKPFPSMARLADVTECTCAEVVGNYLYVANEMVGSSVIFWRYHTASNVWEKLPSLVSSSYSLERIRCLCTVNEHVYAFSDSDLAQRYSLPQNDWQGGIELPSLNKKGHRKRSVFVTAVSMKSKIYVLRGYYRLNAYNHGYKEKPAVFHRFDPQKNEWKKRASTIHPHFESTLFVENNTLYVAGGTVSVVGARATGGPAPVEVYNEGRNSWDVVEQNHIPSNNLGAVELLGGKVYFIINKFPIDSGIRIPPNEVYTIPLGQWEHLGTIDDAAVLCYLSVKKEMLNTQ